MNKNILIVGPVLVDITVGLTKASALLQGSLNISLGGKGYNIAKNTKLFGLNVSLATVYGDDDLGNYIVEEIKKSGIEYFPENKIKGDSGVFVGVNGFDGETILDKANTAIFEQQELPEIDWAKIDVVIILSSTNKVVMDKLMEVKKINKKMVFCLEISGRKTINGIIEYLPNFDFFISNYKEASQLVNHFEVELEIKTIIQEILNRGVKTAIITADKEGFYVGCRENNESVIEKFDAKKVKNIVSTIGAGDTITAAFCSAYYGLNKSLIDSADIASELASYTIAQKDPFLKCLPESIKDELKIK